jgi:ABC-type dipeptide/oligopeptide/nickel transport system permease component
MTERVIARLGSALLVMLGFCTIVFMLIPLVVNTLTDLAYPLPDPRIRLSC